MGRIARGGIVTGAVVGRVRLPYGRAMPISYARHQFPPVVIQHAVWLYVRFTLSYRDVEVDLPPGSGGFANEP